MARRLSGTTGNADVDHILEETIDVLASTFPGRVRAVYLSGSYANAEAGPTSDIDGLVVFRGDLTEEEARRFADATDALSRQSGALVDLGARGEAALVRQGELPAKAASRRLIYGDDIRPAVPALPLWRYTAQIMQGSWFYLSLMRGGQEPLAIPLAYPDHRGEFFGYERNGLRSLDGWDHPGLKALVGGITLAASTLVAIKAGVGVVRSSDSVGSYRRYIGDRWTDWLEAIYDQCKARWAYRIPESSVERQMLRNLCRQALRFENDYLAMCQDYLAAESRQRESSRQVVAAQCLRMIGPAGRPGEKRAEEVLS